MPSRRVALCALLLMAGCATSAPDKPAPRPRAARRAPPPPVTPPATDDGAEPAPAVVASGPTAPAPEAPPAPAPAPASPAPKADPFGDVGMREVNEKDWLAGVRRGIAQREGIAPSEVRFSPGFLRAAFVRSPPVPPVKPGRRAPPRRHEIVVVDNQGHPVVTFRAVAMRGSDEPPADLQFLSDERLVYEAVARPLPPAPPPPPPKKQVAAKARGHAGARAAKAKVAAGPAHAAPAAPPVPPRLFVIQPLESGARPIRCEGLRFTFTREHDRLAFTGGPAGTAFVAVDGAQVYPRRGRTVVASAPAWSKDGRSLAFLEAPPARAPRLVLVAALDNPSGDVTWDLPADANIEGAAVAWTGAGKLVVRRAATRPIFSATFVTER